MKGLRTEREGGMQIPQKAGFKCREREDTTNDDDDQGAKPKKKEAQFHKQITHADK